MRSLQALIFPGIIGPTLASLYLTLDVCPWTPLQVPNLISLSALATKSADTSQDPSEGYLYYEAQDPLESDEDPWTGPHACADRYCAWTNNAFSGRGMSIVTTDLNGDRINDMEPDERDTLVQHLPFNTTHIAGKGIGMIANRVIKRGELILAAPPALLMHRQLMADLSGEEQQGLLDAAVANLPESRRQIFLAQAAELGGHRTKDIMLTNSFRVDLGDDDGQHLGNWPEVSRYNHDCRPNVAFYIDQDLVHRTHAIRDILPGEELTISYLDSFKPRSARQLRAKVSWGFECTCPQCRLPKSEADASDARLDAIYHVESQLADFNNKNVTPDMVEELMRLYKEERLEVKMADAYTIAALNYNQFGMTDMAKEYATLSIEQGLLEHGPRAPDIGVMQKLIQDPTKHWSYNRRPWNNKEL